MKCISQGNVEEFKKILNDAGDEKKQWIDEPLKSLGGITLLFNTILYQQTEMLKFCLDSGANPNACTQLDEDTSKISPLIFATKRRYPELMELLIDGGAEINWQMDDGNTALHYAISDDTTRILLEKGANMGIKNNKGEIAINQSPFNEVEAFLDTKCLDPVSLDDNYTTNAMKPKILASDLELKIDHRYIVTDCK